MTEENRDSRWLETHGHGHLSDILSMHRQQDSNFWSLSGLFAATNGVLIVALFSAMGKIATNSEVEVYFGLIGLVLCLCWYLIAVRSTSRAHHYKELAKELQGGEGLAIPEKYRIWKREPIGIKSVHAFWTLILTFWIVWAWSALFGAYQLGIAWLVVAFLFTLGVAVIAVLAYCDWKCFGKKKGV